MSKPTVVQREILILMAHGDDLEESCCDYNAICVGAHRHIPRRTFCALIAGGWIAPYTDPRCAVGAWFLTDLGRAALGAATTTPGAEREGQGAGL